jgi:hypothetical protein
MELTGPENYDALGFPGHSAALLALVADGEATTVAELGRWNVQRIGDDSGAHLLVTRIGEMICSIRPRLSVPAERRRGDGNTYIWNLERGFPQRDRIMVGHGEYFNEPVSAWGAGASVEAYEPVGLAAQLQSLTGRVWFDFDADDVDDTEENWEVEADAVYIGTASEYVALQGTTLSDVRDKTRGKRELGGAGRYRRTTKVTTAWWETNPLTGRRFALLLLAPDLWTFDTFLAVGETAIDHAGGLPGTDAWFFVDYCPIARFVLNGTWSTY